MASSNFSTSDESEKIFSKSNLKRPSSTSLAPFKCPLTKCDVIISESTVLSHFIIHHQRDDDSVDFQEIKEREKKSLMVDKKYFKFGKCICLGLLTYFSPNITIGDHLNSLLTAATTNLESHLPILIMGYKTNYSELLESSGNKTERNPAYDVTLLWLATIETDKPIYATVTVYNEDQNVSLSSIMKVRSFKQTQDPIEIFRDDTNFLSLCSGFVNSLNSDSSDAIIIEILIQENFDEDQ